MTDVRAAVRDEVLLFEGLGSNTCIHVPPAEIDPQLFEGCDVTITGSVQSQRISALPIEPRSTIAQFGDDGGLTIWLCTQTPHTDKMVLGLVLGLEPDGAGDRPDVGGFGGVRPRAREGRL